MEHHDFLSKFVHQNVVLLYQQKWAAAQIKKGSDWD